MKDRVQELSKSLQGKLLEIRRHIHSHPELSFEEHETASYVESFLEDWGIPNKRMATTGVIGIIEGGKPGKTVALRADLDALPILEQNEVSYKSQRSGVMHACGHDVHTTCLLGAAYILQQNRDQIQGQIKLIFQPGEEKLPGGASLLIKEGVLEDPKVDYIIGQHVMPLIDAGSVGFREGLYMASTDELFLTIEGKGGHGAMPHLCIDPVSIASSVVVELQQVISRHCPPHIPSVLSFGKFIANGVTNVIPGRVELEGTFRTLDEEWRNEAHGLIERIVSGIVKARGADFRLEINRGYPFLKNHSALTRSCKAAAEDYLGSSRVEELGIWMAAEDFAWYSHKVPATFYRLGVRNTSEGIVHSVHHPQFNIDESALETGAGLMAYMAMEVLEKGV